MSIGNTFETKKTNYKPAQRVWRTVRHVYPVGGKLDTATLTKWAGKSVIPAGTPCHWKGGTGGKEITCYADNEITDSHTPFAGTINGFLKEDIYVTGGITSATVASGTVAYAGELYGYMFNSDVLAKLKALTTVPQIAFVD